MAFKKIPLTIDTMIRNPVPVEGINQEDNIELNIVVTENKTPKDLSSQTIKVYVRRIDGTLVEQTDQITPTNASKGEVTVKLKNSAFNKEGYALFQLDVSDSIGRITSSYATFKIGKGLVSGEAIANTNEINALKQIEEYVKKANKELETFKQTVAEISENEATRQENETIRVREEASRNEAERMREIEFEKIKNSKIKYGKIDDKAVSKRNIRNGTVTEEGTTFFIVNGVNKINTEMISEIGYILRASTGELVADEIGCISDYINVKEGDVIRCNTNWEGCFYDENLVYLEGKEFGVTEFEVPSGAFFYRQSINYQGFLNKVMLTINENIPEKYIPYSDYTLTSNEKVKELIKKTSFKGVMENLQVIEENILIKPQNTTFFTKKSENLYNYETATDGYIINIDGQLKISDTGCVSDFIQIKPNTKYFFSEKWNGAYYDNEKRFIKQKEFGIMNEISPSAAFFIRVSIPIGKKKQYMLTENEQTEQYIPYNPILNFAEGEELKGVAKQLKRTGEFGNEKYKGLKWVAIGDSLTEKNVTATENYTDFVSKELKITCINHGIGGTGYMRRYDINKAFYQRVTDLPQDVDVITIFGSGNDLALMTSLGDITDSTTDTLCGCINKTIDNLLEKFPTTPIGIIAPTPWKGNTPDIGGSQMSRYVDKLEQICRRRGMAYLDLYHYSNLHPDNEKCLNLTYYNKSSVDGNGDGVHPNETGHKLIASRIKEFLKSLIMEV